MVKPLPLDGPRWDELATRMGLDAGRVPQMLRALSASPSQLDVFSEMWPELCSEGTTYEAAYAAAPYLVTFAKGVSRSDSLEYLIVLGLIATDVDQVPDDLKPAYDEALVQALDLALDRLMDCPVDHHLRYLLAAVAAFRGRVDLAGVLQNLDAVQEPCPSCRTLVFPKELQDVIARDQKVTSG